MILIADSGSTKTEWCLADQGRPVRTVVTAGINPFFQTREEIAGEIRDALLPALKGERIDAIYFYGSRDIRRNRLFHDPVLLREGATGAIEVNGIDPLTLQGGQ